MFPLITTKLKDDTLQWLCHNVRPGQPQDIDYQIYLDAFNVDYETLLAILYNFQELSLIEKLTTSRDKSIMLTLKVKAHDFVQQGGFAVMDALNEANIQKILWELEVLKKQLSAEKPDRLEVINKVSSVMSALTTVLAAFSDKG